ncbi:MAG: hypothetical protein D6B28_05520 [Gammaproteobacteria bacterium]|nr:MAG: hypothetical protein D6B28_05520 [Gammaproteobacteria bacterium]
MSEMIHEQISRLLDDDLPEEELDLLLKQLDKSPQFMDKAIRYQAVSNSISNGSEFTYSTTVLERVRTHINKEPNPIVDNNILLTKPVKVGFFNKTLKPAVGAAIAASVAVITVLIYVSSTDTLNTQAPTAAIAQTETQAAPPTQLSAQPATPRSFASPSFAPSGIATVSTNGTKPKQPAMVLDAQQWDRLPQNMRDNVSSYINQHNNYQMVNSNTSRRIIIIEENVRR